MKIKVILPNSSPELAKDRTDDRKAIVGKDTEIEVVCLPHGPVSVENASDEARAIPFILDEIIKAEEEGYDAVTIDCAFDPFPRAIKETATIPVVIGGEASRILAMALGDGFSVIIAIPKAIALVRHNIEASGMGPKLASVRAIDMPRRRCTRDYPGLRRNVSDSDICAATPSGSGYRSRRGSAKDSRITCVLEINSE